MPSISYRVYIRFGDKNCVRFLASGDGVVSGDGLQLFEWIRDPSNIARLRDGLQYIYEADWVEIQRFLEFKLREDRGYTEQQMNKYSGGGDMLLAVRRKWTQFNRLRTGVSTLEDISNAKEITVIPRTAPRKRLDQPGWLYLLNLNQETLEVYEFKDYRQTRFPPSFRLTVLSLYKDSPGKPPGYYIKLKLSELQSMLPDEWTSLHEAHEEALHRLWRRNAPVLQTVPHADTIPFAVLYGSVFHGDDGNGAGSRRSRRLTKAILEKVTAALNRRKPSKMPIIEKKRIKPRDVEMEGRMRRWHARMLRLRRNSVTERYRRRNRKD
ncbi:hypothetical protein EKO27_g599 [Xylaria grammica]|uniref:Uncharacterized protein n=1 Tax=Xylaria grammica TaxID=363999 RepID=A0A439DJA3_9PEZI|nr:hypothetical protein EKO27_g599 [Xylaria grammica]